MGIGESVMGLQTDQGSEAYYLASACSEEALQNINLLSAFQGTGSLALGKGSCSYAVIVGSGDNRTINASGTINNITRKIKIIISQITPVIVISSWQEVADF